jgi:Fe-S oxidoreductase
MPKPQNPPKGYRRIKAIFDAMGEVLMESLLHRKIFKQNVLLGYMHTSIAFGWFMLIVLGNMEAKTTSTNIANPPYYPIFLNFFVPDRSIYPGHVFYSFAMDFFLAIVLSGILLAFFKRFSGKFFGMKRTSKLRGIDQVALYTLWLVFPLRLLSEAFNAHVHGSGNFLTAPVGKFFANYLPVADLEYSMWYAYSVALGAFFIALPWSRFSHIPTEVVLIFLRHLGYKSCHRPSGYTMFDLYACSRCGICIDDCQINIVYKGKNETVTAHYIYDLRSGRENDFALFSCLACGRCEEACPVGVKTVDLRIGNRYQVSKEFGLEHTIDARNQIHNGSVGYFSGCMGKLTPNVIYSMKQIFAATGESMFHIDEEKGVCCGRPLLLAGQIEQSESMVAKNKKRIVESGITLLVTSCPICLKTFKEDYTLDIEVIHHSEYIERLIVNEKLKVQKTTNVVAYHDPCELGRGLGVYETPRNVIQSVATLYQNPDKKSQELCCGGSLAGIALNSEQKQSIAVDAVRRITNGKTETLVTSCPLCKKTFAQTREAYVKDIAEIVAENLVATAVSETSASKQELQEVL